MGKIWAWTTEELVNKEADVAAAEKQQNRSHTGTHGKATAANYGSSYQGTNDE